MSQVHRVVSRVQFGDYEIAHNQSGYNLGEFGGEDKDIYTSNRVEATYIPTGERAGLLDWDNDRGARLSVHVDEKHQRKGLATEMLKVAAKPKKGVNKPTHSEIRTKEGDAWAKATRAKGINVRIPKEPKKWIDGYPA